jgi:chaperone modulatory protein CbpM
MRITVKEVCEQEQLSYALVVELVEYDILRPVAGSSGEDWVFDCTGLHWLKRAIRLQHDLDLDWLAVATVLDLLREREILAEENRLLKQRLSRFLSEDD